MDIPHVHPGVWPDPLSPARFAATIARTRPEGCAIALLGLPDDTGIRMNAGRPGAALGPSALRAALARYGSAEPAGFSWPRVYDAGDVVPVPGDLHATHQRVTDATSALLDAGLFPIAIGGGHDLTFPFVRAVSLHLAQPVVALYFDAHLDVRAEPGSGMPFRSLVDAGHASELHAQGLDRFANSRHHLDWFLQHNGHVGAFGRNAAWPPGHLCVSLDLDVIDQAHAPGVSATNPNGWSPMLAEQWCAAAGRCPRVRCFDIMELSPPHDPDARTARLAARLLLAFLHAFTERTP